MGIVTDVRQLINETSAVFWTDQQVYDSINGAQLELWAESGAFWGTATITATASGVTVSLPESSVMIPKFIVGTSGKEYLTTYADLERNTKAWKATGVGEPKWWVLWDVLTLKPYPRSDSTRTYVVHGIAWPTEVSASVTDITAPPDLKKAVMYKAVGILFEHTRPELADGFNAIAQEHLQRFKITQRNYDSHNIRHIRPGNTMSNQRRGSTIASRYV